MKFIYISVLLWIAIALIPQTIGAQRIYAAEVYKEIYADYAIVEAWVWRQSAGKSFIRYDWGDGTPLDTLSSDVSIPLGFYDGNYYFLDTYKGTHIYDTTGILVMGFQDSFLIEGLVNIENSGEKILSIYDTLVIYDQEPETLQFNTSPEFFSKQGEFTVDDNGVVVFPIDVASDEIFGILDIYNSFLSPFPAEGYSLPEASDSIYMIPPVGAYMYWDRPTQPGWYALGINVREERRVTLEEGVIDTFLLSTTMRALTFIIDEDMIVSTPMIMPFSTTLQVYPNPTSDYLNIQLKNFNKVEAVLSIYNTMGQEVYSEPIHLTSKLQSMEVSVTDLPAGVYFLKVEQGRHVTVRKFVKD
ncbi:MAG: T9SS type A sorting domain-containing protein [Chitinophagales bacterium]|nr:T9SS type A sorting domain-containing protein [Chitinophagales bacterium]